jgi:hypothetical protein
MALRKAGRLLPLVQAALADSSATAQRSLSHSFASTSAAQSSAAVNVSASRSGPRWCRPRRHPWRAPSFRRARQA